MAIGKLASSNPNTEVGTIVYTVPAGYNSTFTVSVVNTGDYSGTITLATLDSGNTSPTTKDYIEYQTTLQPKSVYERTGLVLSSNQSLYILGTTNKFAVNVFGFEQTN